MSAKHESRALKLAEKLAAVAREEGRFLGLLEASLTVAMVAKDAERFGNDTLRNGMESACEEIQERLSIAHPELDIAAAPPAAEPTP